MNFSSSLLEAWMGGVVLSFFPPVARATIPMTEPRVAMASYISRVSSVHRFHHSIHPFKHRPSIAIDPPRERGGGER